MPPYRSAMGVRDRIPRMMARFADSVEGEARRERARAVVKRWNDELVACDLRAKAARLCVRNLKKD